ncbi:MAG: polysaccharide biosynthesis protein [Dehalococcoidia bacterium]
MSLVLVRRYSLARGLRLLLTLAVDGAIVFACYLAALLLRFDGRVPRVSIQLFHALAPLIILAYLTTNLIFGIYRTAWQYGGLADVLSLAQATGSATLLLFLTNWAQRHRDLPLSVMVVGGALIFLVSGFSKLSPRLLARRQWVDWPAPTKRLLIAGGGNTGQFVAREFQQHPAWGYRPVGFVDDDPSKRHMRIHRVPVAGRTDEIERVVREYGIDLVALAIPSADGAAVRRLVTACQEINVPVRVVPGLPEVVRDQTSVGYLRELTVEDLLGREAVDVDFSLCRESLHDARVLITGAAGSIGAELARQVIGFGPSALHLLDINESGLHDLQQELRVAEPDCELRVWLADISDAGRLGRVFEQAGPQVVFHAAAYKHVHLMEEFPEEAFRVNVLGTLNVCQAADLYRASKMVFISTDKAVNPSSVMGATKRIGELLMLAMARRSATAYCAVRFGNVIGSRGSAVPTFWNQIAQGGPVTVRHPDVRRFFLTIPEAVSLVIQAAAFAQTGQIYMLDMGDEIRILDLAEKMIRMRGLQPQKEIEIVFTGLLPGEKLREELAGPGELTHSTRHPKVLLTESEPGPDLSRLLSAITLARPEQAAGRAALGEWLQALARLSPEALSSRQH